MRLVKTVFNITGLNFAAIINASLDFLDTLLGSFFVPKLNEDWAELSAKLHEILSYDSQFFELCHTLQLLSEVFTQFIQLFIIKVKVPVPDIWYLNVSGGSESFERDCIYTKSTTWNTCIVFTKLWLDSAFKFSLIDSASYWLFSLLSSTSSDFLQGI